MPESSQVFIRDFLAALFEHRFVTGVISQDAYHRAQADMAGPAFEQFSQDLFARSPAAVPFPGGSDFKFLQLREMDGSEFPFILGLLKPWQLPVRPLRCFVGHRFLPNIEGPLRFNLAHVLNPYRIRLRWSAQDLSASGVFAEIVRGIRGATMCFFDTYGTSGKPNVFIEIGMAYALGVPMIVAEHISDASDTIEGIPSDLQGLFRIRYTTYEDLFRKLYFGLPNFIAKNKIRAERRKKR